MIRRHSILMLVVIAFGVARSSPSGAASDRHAMSVAVMKLSLPPTFSDELDAAVYAAVARTLGDMRTFEAVSQREVEALLAQERTTSVMMGKEGDVDRITELGAKLEADFVVVGGIVHDKTAGASHLELLRVRPPGTIARVSRDFEGPPEACVPELGILTRLLVRDLLAERSGSLTLVTSEEGATVVVNDRIVGSTPLLEPIELPEGLNTVEIEREGFILERRDVEIVRDRDQEISVTLVPSVEYVEDFKADVRTQALVGWGLVGLSAVAAGGTAYAFIAGGHRADALSRDTVAYNARPQSARTAAEFDALGDQGREIATLDVLVLVGVAVSLTAAATGVGLLVTNDDTNRYDAFEVTDAPGLQVHGSGVRLRF